jgi:TolB protein
MFNMKSVLYLAVGLISGLALAQRQVNSSSGIFEGSSDIGLTHQGSTVYDTKTGKYRVTGGGADMWGAADAFHFSWLRLSGDVTLTADVEFPRAAPFLSRRRC